MNNIQIIEHQEQRVLTTQQLAESYGTESKIISNNFNRNIERYQEGKDFYCLEGENLKAFKTNHQFDESSKLNKLYLWTERGALFHAKSLNTDKAWDVYVLLVENYYNAKKSQQYYIPQTYKEALQLAADLVGKLEEARPKVAYHDKYMEFKGSHSFKDVAGLLGVHVTVLTSFLRDRKIIQHNIKKENIPTKAYLDSGYFKVTHTDKYIHTRVTPVGLKWIGALFKGETNV